MLVNERVSAERWTCSVVGGSTDEIVHRQRKGEPAEGSPIRTLKTSETEKETCVDDPLTPTRCVQIDLFKGCQILKQNPDFRDGRCIT